jgi:hypothetical protein
VVNVIYEGWPGTGLRLEDEKPYRVLDTGGSHGANGGMTLFVGEEGSSATIELDPLDVARLAAMCSQWLAWHHSGRGTRADRI